MSRRSLDRVGLYYLALRGRAGRIGCGETDCAAFIAVLDTVLRRTGYRLHAYCVLATQAHLAVQMSEVPLADFAQRLIMQFGRWMQQRGRANGLLEQVGEPRLVDGPDRCRELIRFIHLLPLKSGQDPARYAWSGHRTYLGTARVSCLDTRLGYRLFARDPREARRGYEQYVAQGLQAVEASRLGRSLDRASRRPESAPPSGQAPPTHPDIGSVEALAARVAALGGRPVSDLLSCSRARQVSLLRALTAWHAVRLEMATFREVARYLHRDPSSLYSAIKRYSALHPQLFAEAGRLDGLTDVAAKQSG
jgi:hypothetical protein